MNIDYSSLRPSILNYLKQALSEDTGNGDHTSLSTIAPEDKGIGHVRFKQEGIVAGIDVAVMVASLVDDQLLCSKFNADGDSVKNGTVVMELAGSMRSLLQEIGRAHV